MNAGKAEVLSLRVEYSVFSGLISTRLDTRFALVQDIRLQQVQVSIWVMM
jgi:hypothetical protein